MFNGTHTTVYTSLSVLIVHGLLKEICWTTYYGMRIANICSQACIYSLVLLLSVLLVLSLCYCYALLFCYHSVFFLFIVTNATSFTWALAVGCSDNPGLVRSSTAARSVDVDRAPEGPSYFQQEIIAFQLSLWWHPVSSFCLSSSVWLVIIFSSVWLSILVPVM